MNDNSIPALDSPTSGSFIFACQNEGNLKHDINTGDLLDFIDKNKSVNQLCDTDKSFFPRAFTDVDLVNNCDLEIEKNSEKKINGQNAAAELTVRDMMNSGKNYQPDVIVSNSNQRSGPDGSPALGSPGSQFQGFVPMGNLSETGELFAPVRTLTFSDVDQNSHIEDSYVNTSRLVSTPNRGNVQQRMQNSQNHDMDSDSDSDEGMRLNSGDASPEFRQLEGEAETDLTNTGAFKPSAIGLNKEFMDNFTGRTGNQSMEYTGDIFSPLGSGGLRPEGRRSEGKTPPLHSPAPNSPYAKYNLVKPQVIPKDDDEEETQFSMSPTRNPPNFYAGEGNIVQPGGLYGSNALSLINRQDFMNSDRFYSGSYSSEHMFKPIEQQPKSSVTKTLPKNLNDYEIEHPSIQQDKSRGTAPHFKPDFPADAYTSGGEEFLLESARQGNKEKLDDKFDQQFASVSPSAFEQRYLQRSQVSVKLPQATYDTMSPQFSQEDRMSGDFSQTGRLDPPGLMPDSMGEEEDIEVRAGNRTKSSPEKVVDLLQSQVEHLKHTEKQNSEALQGQGDEPKRHTQTGKPGMNQKGEAKEVSKQVHSTYEQNGDTNRENTHGGDNHNVTCTQIRDPQSSSISTAVSNTGSANVLSQNQVTKSSDLGQGIKSTASTQHAQSFQGSTSTSSSHAPSSRLLQETVSQKNKTSQKYISSGYGVSKQGGNLQKEFKKPFDVSKNSNQTTNSGTKKSTNSETEKGPKSKSLGDRTKLKSMSSETINAKSKSNTNQSRNNTNRNEYPAGTQSKNNSANLGGNQSSQGPLIRGQGYVRAGTQHGSPHSLDGHRGEGRVVTQVETTSPVPIETPEQNFPSLKAPQSAADASLDVRGMEEVRHQLQSMLRLSHDTLAPHERSQYEHSEIVAGFGMDADDHYRQVDMSWNVVRKAADDEMLENFPSFTSQFLADSGNVSRSDVSLNAENQRLRDMLEKERYRRKHCEQYIQQLNVKLLETQQQVAVAVSTDKRKDIMIEQLDKQLARVVEGWKKRDQDKDAMIERAKQEKEDIQHCMEQQQEMISRFEHDMSDAVEALRREKENSAQVVEQYKEKVIEAETKCRYSEEMVAGEKEKVDLLQQECDNLREARDTLDKKLDQMQRRLHREQDEWFQREQELLQRIDEVSEKNAKVLQTERVKNEEQGRLAEEIMEKYQEASTRSKKLEMDLDAALREKESIKIEMGIMEAKFENAHRVLEADMHSTMEKQISEQIADVQKRNEKAEGELREKHREQVVEMNQRHGREMEKQLAVFREEVAKKEEDYRKQLQELEERLVQYRNENSELKLAKQKLESTRLEILTKLQYAMQSQWNEALSMLAGTPQRKPATDDGVDSSVVTSHSLQAVNFSFHTPVKQPTNQQTPPRLLANQHPSLRNEANQHSLPRLPANQNSSPLTIHSNSVRETSPVGMDEQHQEGLELSPISVAASSQMDVEKSVESNALSHFKDFQEYMNSLTKTPEWIATINSRADSLTMTQPLAADGPTMQPDLAALLSTHLHTLHQHASPSQPQLSISGKSHAMHSQSSIQLPHHAPVPEVKPSSQSARPSTAAIGQKQKGQSLTPPKSAAPANQVELSQSGISQSGDVNASMQSVAAGYGDVGAEMLWAGAPGMSRAVPIRPPQQGEDPYLHDEEQSMLSDINGGAMHGYFRGGQSFSPPTKQDRSEGEDGSLEDIHHESGRLQQDYSALSERMEKHESHQNELQHYIQMLLNKTPSEAVEQNDSMYSHDHDDLDLDDTAQAAQLRRELDRIQELRQKQEASSRSTATKTEVKAQGPSSEMLPKNKILNIDQLAEVSKLLNQVKGQNVLANNSQVTELLELLKHAQGSPAQPQGKPGSKHSPKHNSSQGDKHRGLTAVKRGAQVHPAGKPVEASKQRGEGNKHDKSGPRPAPSKKMERKVAGATAKGDKSSKPSAWK